MKCPYCKTSNTRVVDSRPGKIELEVRRRRECQSCSQRFTTYERVEQVPVMIIKKDNRREEYDREKVLKGIKKACEKRAISMDLIENLVDGIERDLRELLPGLLQHEDPEIAIRCEKLIRTYDPCISCSTHFLKLDLKRR